MLTVTKKAATVLKAVQAVEGAGRETGIRIRRSAIARDSGGRTQALSFAIVEQPSPGDQESEQNGLRIFVDEQLIEMLDGRTLDVSNEGEGRSKLVFR